MKDAAPSPIGSASAGIDNVAYSGSEDDVRNGDVGEVAAGRSRDQLAANREAVALEDDSDDFRCGLGSCRPDCLQACNNPKAVLAVLCLFSFVQGFMVNGINNVNTSTLEKRFELTSSQAGLISSSYDISAAVFSIPISYYGAHAHQPRMLTLAALSLALGAFLMSVPHFATGLYDLKSDLSDECILGTNGTLPCDDSGSRLSMWLGMFILGMILNGLGGTTLYSVGVVFIDNSVSPRTFPLYQGFLYSSSILGPALGYLLGGYFIGSLYVDFDKTGHSVEVSPDDPRFVGAWWLGFLASGALLVIVAMLLMCYPKEVPAAKKARLKRQSEALQTSGNSVAFEEGFGTKWRHLPVALKILLTNPVYMCLNMSGASEGLIVSGLATFLPKFIQNQFVVSAGYSAMLAGAVSVTGAAGGQFAGGLICKLAKLRVRGMLKMNVVASALATLLIAVFLCRCSTPAFAGISTSYENTTQSLTEVNLVSTCNSDCGCTTFSYEPVCGINNVQYFSPCHGGCRKATLNGTKMFVNCSCVNSGSGEDAVAVPRVCEVDCPLLYVFLPVSFLCIFVLFTAAVPSLSATMRCIPDSQRSFGIGVQWVFLRLLGSIPGPVLMGAIFDSTCEVWQESCRGSGSCWIYDNYSLSIRLMVLGAVVKTVSTFFFSLALVVYKPPPMTDARKRELQLSDNTGQSNSTTSPSDGRTRYHKEVNGFVNCGADLSSEDAKPSDNTTTETTDL